MVETLIYFIQEKILFRPTVLPQDFKFEFQYDFEELFLKTDRDAVINALHFKARNPKGIILYFHGNSGNLLRWGKVTEFFVEKQYDVLVIDYRTYGKSVGVLSEQALYHDASYCYDFLKERYEEKDITVYGRSLGTGIAAYVASKNHPKNLILETPYYSMIDVAKIRFPMFPVQRISKYKLPTHEFIQQVKKPILILHGSKDRVVPFESGRKLYEASPKELTTLIKIEGGTHKDLIHFEAYQAGIEAVLK